MSDLVLNRNNDVIDSQLEEYIFSIAQGDLTCMSELYEKTNSKIYAYSLSLLKNKADAEDVTHDCYVAVYNNAYQYKSKGKPLAWMITIARNLALAKLNERKRYLDNEILEYQVAEQEGLGAVEKHTIEMCMNILDTTERQIIILHAVSGFKHREIAKLLEMPLSTVLSKYNRGIKKLKAQYEKGEKDE